jgi:hypothetical protein
LANDSLPAPSDLARYRKRGIGKDGNILAESLITFCGDPHAQYRNRGCMWDPNEFMRQLKSAVLSGETEGGVQILQPAIDDGLFTIFDGTMYDISSTFFGSDCGGSRGNLLSPSERPKLLQGVKKSVLWDAGAYEKQLDLIRGVRTVEDSLREFFSLPGARELSEAIRNGMEANSRRDLGVMVEGDGDEKVTNAGGVSWLSSSRYDSEDN